MSEHPPKGPIESSPELVVRIACAILSSPRIDPRKIRPDKTKWSPVVRVAYLAVDLARSLDWFGQDRPDGSDGAKAADDDGGAW